jgi:hypothetical protein
VRVRCIDDVDVLRSGSMNTLFDRVNADPPPAGTVPRRRDVRSRLCAPFDVLTGMATGPARSRAAGQSVHAKTGTAAAVEKPCRCTVRTPVVLPEISTSGHVACIEIRCGRQQFRLRHYRRAPDLSELIRGFLDSP